MRQWWGHVLHQWQSGGAETPYVHGTQTWLSFPDAWPSWEGPFCQVPSVTWLDHSQLFPMRLHQGSSVSAPHHKLLTKRKWDLLSRLGWDRWDIVCITQGHHTEHLWNRQLHQEKMSNIIQYVSRLQPYSFLGITVEKCNLIYRKTNSIFRTTS